MATEAVIPPVAPAATPSAPTPTTTPTPTPTAAPETTTITTVTAPETTATPTTTTPAAPKAGDFAQDEQGIQDFIKAKMKYDGEHPEVETEAVKEEPQAAEPEIAESAAEQVEAQDLPEEPAVTPEFLGKMELEHPELKALFDAQPAVKGAFYKMARENAKLAPLAEIFPNVEAAQFAAETARSTVDIRGALMRAADEPESMDEAFQSFVDLFMETDDQGQPIMENGYPKLGKDFEMLTGKVVDNYLEGELDYYGQRLEQNQYVSETARENDEAAVAAIKFLAGLKDASVSDMDMPDLSDVPDSARSYIERQKAEIERQKAELQGRQQAQTAQERQAARQTHETTTAKAVGSQFGERLEQMIGEKLAAGVYIPQFAIKKVDPQTGVSYFAKDVYDTFMEKTVGRPVRQANGKIKFIGGQPKYRNDLAALERLAPSETSQKQRVDFFAKLREEYLPGIVDAKIREIQGFARQDRMKGQKRDNAARDQIGSEPRGGTPVRTGAMSAEQAMEQARKNVAEKTKDQFLSPGDVLELELKEFQRLAP